MKFLIKSKYLLALFAITTAMISCQKDTDVLTDDSASTIVVAASLSAVSAAAPVDSVHILQPCNRGSQRESILASALPSTVTDYLTTNYNGYTFAKAFAIKDANSNVTGYVVVIYFNSKPVGMEFTLAGSFVKILEQRERGDLHGNGYHRGGRFEERGRFGKDTIALSALPSSITAYFASNYASDTLVKAFKNCDSTIVVLSKNAGLFATVFTSNGIFVERKAVSTGHSRHTEVTEASLLSNIVSYLQTTYPNYVFKKAFSFGNNNVVAGYVVIIDANNTKYAVEFNAAGTFLRAKTLY